MTEPSHGRPPLVLIANAQEWSARSLETILGPAGFAVLRAYTDRNAIDRARSARPDAIVLDQHLPDRGGIEVCRQLRADPLITASTPIIISGSGPATRQQRIEALRAGAADFVGQPLDGEEFALRLQAYVRAKFDADHARDESMMDQDTGLYNMRGLAMRARELGAQAFRQSAALGCVVFAPELAEGTAPPGDDEVARAVRTLAKALRSTGRLSDAIGRLGPTEFAVFAPETDAAGLLKLADRLLQNLASRANGGETPVPLRAGYDAVPDVRAAPLDPVDLLVHATSALRAPRSPTRPAGWIQRFERVSGPS